MVEGQNHAWKEFRVEIGTGLVMGGATVLAALLGGQPADIAGVLGIICGLLASMLLFCVRSFKAIRQQSINVTAGQEKVLERQSRLLQAVKEYVVDRKFGLLRVIDCLALQIKKENVPKVWRQLLWDVDKEYLATNYLRDIYDTPWAAAALAIQEAKIKESLVVQKVFIVNDKRELRRCLDFFHSQQSAGVQAKYILKEKLSSDELVAARLQQVHGQIDFGIFDGRHVLQWDLTADTRKLAGGSILTSQPDVEKFREVFHVLYEAAQDLPPRLEFVPLINKARAEIHMWPAYQDPYEDLNYAIDETDGWLRHQGEIPGTIVLGGYRAKKLLAFSLLVPSDHGSYEFYVAVRATDLHNGVGREMTRLTVRYAFDQCGMDRVWLKVRKSHEVGMKLYPEEGFVSFGTKKEKVLGNMVEFELMQQFNSSAS